MKKISDLDVPPCFAAGRIGSERIAPEPTAFGEAPGVQAREAQQAHWERQLGQRAHMFGAQASDPAREAAELLLRRGARDVLELGAGQGRDTLYLAAQGFAVTALDYAACGVESIARLAEEAGLSGRVRALRHDVRQPLPLEDGAVDACYAHMLLCMALTLDELHALCAEVRRVLRPGGIFVYTVRHEGDPLYGAGRHGGENMYESGGFMVHFFHRGMVDALARGFALREVQPFEEGDLPRKLWRVTQEKE